MEIIIYAVKLDRAGRDMFGTYHGKEKGKKLFYVKETSKQNRIDWFLRTKNLSEAKKRVLSLCDEVPHIWVVER